MMILNGQEFNWIENLEIQKFYPKFITKITIIYELKFEYVRFPWFYNSFIFQHICHL